MIGFRDLSLSFGDLLLFDHLDFQLTSGEVSCLLGPSGCGKTTMLNLIAGLVRPDSGEVTVDGRLSYVFQESRLLPWETVRGNAAYAMDPRLHRKERLARTDGILAVLELSDAAHKYPGEISGGMARRTALARALLAPHSILLLDEPLSSLDPDMRERVVSRLPPLLEGRTVVLVTHDYRTAAALSHRVCRLSLPPVRVADVDKDRLRGTLHQIELIDRERLSPG